jgi:hypothetical protein
MEDGQHQRRGLRTVVKMEVWDPQEAEMQLNRMFQDFEKAGQKPTLDGSCIQDEEKLDGEKLRQIGATAD